MVQLYTQTLHATGFLRTFGIKGTVDVTGTSGTKSVNENAVAVMQPMFDRAPWRIR
jgi:hypothetical protein